MACEFIVQGYIQARDVQAACVRHAVWDINDVIHSGENVLVRVAGVELVAAPAHGGCNGGGQCEAMTAACAAKYAHRGDRLQRRVRLVLVEDPTACVDGSSTNETFETDPGARRTPVGETPCSRARAPLPAHHRLPRHASCVDSLCCFFTKVSGADVGCTRLRTLLSSCKRRCTDMTLGDCFP